MIILYVYLGTIACSFSLVCLTGKAVNQEIKNEGYVYKKEKKNVWKSIIDYLKTVGYCSIPIFNLFIGGYFIIKYEDIYQDIFSDSLRAGELIKIEEIKDENVSDNVDNNFNEVITYNVNSELTREEKIKFLRQEYFRLTNQQIDDSKKSKKTKQKNKI